MIDIGNLLFYHTYYEEKALIYSKGAISERGVDNLGVSLYKSMLYSYIEN